MCMWNDYIPLPPGELFIQVNKLLLFCTTGEMCVTKTKPSGKVNLEAVIDLVQIVQTETLPCSGDCLSFVRVGSKDKILA